MALIVDISQSENKIVTGLQLAVANTYVLTALTHNAHWNVIGDDFFQLHSAFNDQYEALFDKIDVFAERIRQLGSFVSVNLANFNSIAQMPDLVAPFEAEAAVSTLLLAHLKAISNLRDLSNLANTLNDLETQQIVLDALLWHEKITWFLKSYLSE